MKSKVERKYLIVKPTHKYGNGVYAGRDLLKGEIIHVLSGKRMDLNQLISKIKSGKESLDDPFQVGRRTYIDLDELSRTFNHCCDPNGGIRKRSELFAVRDIKKGEEITYDYSITISPTEWSMKCKCGSKNCRKILHDIRSIPRPQIQTYKELGAIQNYMKKLLKEIETGRYRVPQYEVRALEKLAINK